MIKIRVIHQEGSEDIYYSDLYPYYDVASKLITDPSSDMIKINETCLEREISIIRQNEPDEVKLIEMLHSRLL